jgi:hypothetical protein
VHVLASKHVLATFFCLHWLIVVFLLASSCHTCCRCRLLLCASATVTHNASHLAQLLHLPGTQALRPLISRMPNLLGFSGATLAEKLGSLQQAMGLSRDMVVAMVGVVVVVRISTKQWTVASSREGNYSSAREVQRSQGWWQQVCRLGHLCGVTDRNMLPPACEMIGCLHHRRPPAPLC